MTGHAAHAHDAVKGAFQFEAVPVYLCGFRAAVDHPDARWLVTREHEW